MEHWQVPDSGSSIPSPRAQHVLLTSTSSSLPTATTLPAGASIPPRPPTARSRRGFMSPVRAGTIGTRPGACSSGTGSSRGFSSSPKAPNTPHWSRTAESSKYRSFEPRGGGDARPGSNSVGIWMIVVYCKRSAITSLEHVLSVLANLCACSCPSGCLLEHPEDAAFYDWLLLDSKESPYATFRFYYRSWAKLRFLNVIPPSRTSDSPGLFAYGGLEGAPTTPPLSKRSPYPKFDVGRPPVECHDTSEKDEKEESSVPNESPNKGPRIQFPLTNPPEVLQARSSSPCLPQPSKKTRDGFLDRGPSRPLPALPSRPSWPKKLSLDVPAPTINPENPLGQDTSQDAAGNGVNRVIPSPVFPSGRLTPPPLSLSPNGHRKKQDECSSTPRPEAKGPRRFSPAPKLSASPKGAATQRTREGPAHQPRSPSPLSKHRDGPHTASHSPSRPKSVTEESVDPSQSLPKPSSPGRGTPPPRFELGGNGIPALPRGLLGPALTEIPLRGPTGELMKKLRSEDPFRDD